MAEIEHIADTAGDRFERTAAQPAGIPVILDKAHDRTLIGDGVVDEVRLCIRRDHHERQPRAVAAASFYRIAIVIGQGSVVAAQPRAIQIIAIRRAG